MFCGCWTQQVQMWAVIVCLMFVQVKSDCLDYRRGCSLAPLSNYHQQVYPKHRCSRGCYYCQHASEVKSHRCNSPLCHHYVHLPTYKSWCNVHNQPPVDNSCKYCCSDNSFHLTSLPSFENRPSNDINSDHKFECPLCNMPILKFDPLNTIPKYDHFQQPKLTLSSDSNHYPISPCNNHREQYFPFIHFPLKPDSHEFGSPEHVPQNPSADANVVYDGPPKPLLNINFQHEHRPYDRIPYDPPKRKLVLYVHKSHEHHSHRHTVRAPQEQRPYKHVVHVTNEHVPVPPLLHNPEEFEYKSYEHYPHKHILHVQHEHYSHKYVPPEHYPQQHVLHVPDEHYPHKHVLQAPHLHFT